MKIIIEKIWKRATTELNYHNTKENFEYEEPLIDLVLDEVENIIEKSQESVARQSSHQSMGWHNALEQLKSDLRLVSDGVKK